MAKNETPKKSRIAQIKQVYKIAKDEDPNLPIWLAGIFLAVLLCAIILGLIFHNMPTALIIGIPLGLLAMMFFLGKKAETGAYASIEGQTGASGAVFQSLRRGWITEEQPIAINPRTKDLVFRAIGKPGVVLVSEGPANRVKKMLNKEKQKVQAIAGKNVPIHLIQAGNGEGQIPLKDASKKILKLKNQITAAEVTEISRRLSALGNTVTQQIPKGVDPNRARPNRKMMR
ncbi:MAG: DUF4191 domain-containing protein [Micrococcaceae bacterium]